jgi:hypothetical protein
VIDYVRRCKKKEGSGRHDRLHAAEGDHTLCGKELNEMWWSESSGFEPEDVSCPKCRKVMREEK